MRSSLFSFPFATAVTKLHSALVFFLPVTDMHPGKQIHRLNRGNSREWGILGSNCPDPCKVFSSSSWKLAAPGATLGSFLQEKLGLGQQNPRREIWLAQSHGLLSTSHFAQLVMFSKRSFVSWRRKMLEECGWGESFRPLPRCEMSLNFVLVEALDLWAPWGAVAHTVHTQQWQPAEFGFFSIFVSQLKSQSALGFLTHGCDLSFCRHLLLKGNEERLNLRCRCKYS